MMDVVMTKSKSVEARCWVQWWFEVVNIWYISQLNFNDFTQGQMA